MLLLVGKYILKKYFLSNSPKLQNKTKKKKKNTTNNPNTKEKEWKVKPYSKSVQHNSAYRTSYSTQDEVTPALSIAGESLHLTTWLFCV